VAGPVTIYTEHIDTLTLTWSFDGDDLPVVAVNDHDYDEILQIWHCPHDSRPVVHAAPTSETQPMATVLRHGAAWPGRAPWPVFCGRRQRFGQSTATDGDLAATLADLGR